jgi:hypothetical protein
MNRWRISARYSVPILFFWASRHYSPASFAVPNVGVKNVSRQVTLYCLHSIAGLKFFQHNHFARLMFRNQIGGFRPHKPGGPKSETRIWRSSRRDQNYSFNRRGMAVTKFRNDILEHLKFYVYRLVDPRSNRTFYVGKGQDNRVFQHIREEIEANDEDLMSLKLETIKDIKNNGANVEFIIHRHGMDEVTAFNVEAALIDAYDDLANMQSGHYAHQFGMKTAQEIEELYSYEEALIRHKVVIIDISRTFGRKSASRSRDDVYDAVRFQWRASLERIKRCEYVLAQRGGVVVGIFEPSVWLQATPENFPEFIGRVKGFRSNRIGFKGIPVSDMSINEAYLRKRIPQNLTGAQNPVRYVGI